MIRSATIWAGLLGVASLTFPVQAFAYLDPGTGSIILQGLLAAIAAGSIAGKLYWRKLVGLLRGKAEPVATMDPVETMKKEAAVSDERDEQS